MGATTPPSLGCTGWYSVSSDTLTASLTFTGQVRSVSLSALLDDGTVRKSAAPVLLRPHTRTRAIRLTHVDGAITSAIAYLTGFRAQQRGACELSSPH